MMETGSVRFTNLSVTSLRDTRRYCPWDRSNGSLVAASCSPMEGRLNYHARCRSDQTTDRNPVIRDIHVQLISLTNPAETPQMNQSGSKNIKRPNLKKSPISGILQGALIFHDLTMHLDNASINLVIPVWHHGRIFPGILLCVDSWCRFGVSWSEGN